MGDPVVDTPHLDSLASASTWFPNGFVTASTCAPSLRTLLTGLHPIQWSSRRLGRNERGMTGGERIRGFATLPRLLARNGYASFQGGKYWDGTHVDGGFTHGMTPLAGAADGQALGRDSLEPLWEFIDEHREQAFFVWFAPMLPHAPHDAPEAYRQRYRDRGLSDRAQRYYANITRFDARLGELLERLESEGLRERTLVVYLSDNGWQQDATEVPTNVALGGARGKASMGELGYRTPILFSLPGVIAPDTVQPQLVSSVDLLPTLLDFAGVEPPAELPGISLHPLLTSGGSFERSRVIGSTGRLRLPPEVEGEVMPGVNLTRPEKGYFLRNADWRFVWYPESSSYGDRRKHELYAIDRDPRETRDLAATRPDLVARFESEIRAWIEDSTRGTD